MQTIGICRFSYLGTGGFQTMHDTLEQRAKFLYDPLRLEQRFAMFEAFTLPSLRGQTDPEFKFLIVTGDSFPAEYLKRLQELTADLPHVITQQHPPGRHRTIMNTAINSVRDFDGKHCLQFRLDDDDAMGVTFVEQAKRAAKLALPMMRGHRIYAVDFNQGYTAAATPDGIEALGHQQLYLGIAMAMIFRPSVKRTVMNFGHHVVWQKMPTITLTGEDMWVRGYNDFNDSMQKDNHQKKGLSPLTPSQEDHFKKVFNIDVDAVRQLFSRPL